MTYTVNFTNNSKLAITIGNNIVDSTTNLGLVGQSYTNYGEVTAENFLHLLENSANSIAPTKPIEGQIWYDSANNVLKYLDDTVANSGNWKSLAVINSQSASPASVGEKTGDFWLDIDDGNLYVYHNAAWQVVRDTSTSLSDEATSADIKAGTALNGANAKLYVNPDKMLNVVDYVTGTDGAIDSAADRIWMKDASASTMSWVSINDMYTALAIPAVPTATTTVSGISELATDTEAALVATTDRVLTPSNLLSSAVGGEIFDKAFNGQLYGSASVPNATAGEVTALSDTNKLFVDGGTGGDAVRVQIADIPFTVTSTIVNPFSSGQTVADWTVHGEGTAGQAGLVGNMPVGPTTSGYWEIVSSYQTSFTGTNASAGFLAAGDTYSVVGTQNYHFRIIWRTT